MVAPQYLEAYSYSEGLAVVYKDGKYGYIDKSGKEVIKPKYDDVYDFSEGLAVVANKGKFGLIDKSGKEIVKMKYYALGSIREGRTSALKHDGQRLLLTGSGKEISLKEEYAGVYDFREGFAWVEALEGYYRFIDKSGKEVAPLKYDGFYQEDEESTEEAYFENGLTRVRLGDGEDAQWGYVNTKGKEVVKIGDYEEVGYYGDGIIPVYKDGVWSLLDKTGKELVRIR